MGSNWRPWAHALCFVGSVAATACNSDPARADATACENVYAKCPNQPPTSSENAAACARSLDGACGTTMRQYVGCVTGKCDDAGVIDRIAVDTECAPLLKAYRDCAAADAEAPKKPPTDVPSTNPPDAGVPDAG